jgi:hypothetical protein
MLSGSVCAGQSLPLGIAHKARNPFLRLYFRCQISANFERLYGAKYRYHTMYSVVLNARENLAPVREREVAAH